MRLPAFPAPTSLGDLKYRLQRDSIHVIICLLNEENLWMYF